MLEEEDNVQLIEGDDPMSPLKKQRTLRSRLSSLSKPPLTKGLVPSFLLDASITAIGQGALVLKHWCITNCCCSLHLNKYFQFCFKCCAYPKMGDIRPGLPIL